MNRSAKYFFKSPSLLSVIVIAWQMWKLSRRMLKVMQSYQEGKSP